MTTIVYRGVPYDREEHYKSHLDWWAFVHRATLWLTYRGVEYRPVTVSKDGPSVF